MDIKIDECCGSSYVETLPANIRLATEADFETEKIIEYSINKDKRGLPYIIESGRENNVYWCKRFEHNHSVDKLLPYFYSEQVYVFIEKSTTDIQKITTKLLL